MEETWEMYLERMDKDKEWGSHIEVIAIADFLGVPIVITNDSSDDEDIQLWVYPTNSTTKAAHLILLGFSLLQPGRYLIYYYI